MDDKKIALFSKALLILWEGLCEEHGGIPVGSRVVVVDADTADSGKDVPSAAP